MGLPTAKKRLIWFDLTLGRERFLGFEFDKKILGGWPGSFGCFAGVFEGGSGKSCVSWWSFAGEFVVNEWWIVVRRWLLFERRKFSIFSNFIFGRTSSMRWRFTPERHGRAESNGIFAAAKMTHLSDDRTVAKMGHPATPRHCY